MKKNQFFSILILLVFMVQSIPNSILIIPVSAAEYENIDSFNVHPANRWDQTVDESTAEISVDDGILDYNGVDGESNESDYWTRQLSKNDFKMTGRMKTPYNPRGFSFPAVDNDMIVYTHMDEGSGNRIDDLTPADRDGLLDNSTMWNLNSFNDKASYCLEFDEENDNRANFGSSSVYSHTNGAGVDNPYSISIWFNMESKNGSSKVIVSKFSTDGNLREYYILQNNGELDWRMFDSDGSAAIGRKFLSTLNINTWYFLTVTYDGSETTAGGKIYIDGVEVAHSSFSSGVYSGMSDTASNMTLANNDISEPGGNFDGELDDFIMWEVELTSNEVLDLYNQYMGISQSETTIGLSDSTLNSNCGIRFDLENSSDSQELVAYFFYNDSSTIQEVNIANLSRNIWVKFEIDIDLLKSELEFTLDYDNDTEIGETTYLDISGNRPSIFSESFIFVYFGNQFLEYSNISFSLDWLKAPYEEYQFIRGNDPIPKNSHFLSTNEFGCRVVGNTFQLGVREDYNLVVPDFDGVSGVIHTSVNETTEVNLNESSGVAIVRLYGIFANNGSAPLLISLIVGFSGYDDDGNNNNTFLDPMIRIHTSSSSLDDTTGPFEISRKIDSLTFNSKIEVPYSFYLTPNKDLIMEVNIIGELYTFEVDMSEYSNEVLIQHEWRSITRGTPSDSSIEYQLGIRDWELQTRDIFGLPIDIPDMPFGDPIGATVDTTKGVLMQGFRLIGSVVDGLGAIIVSPILLIKAVVDTIKLVMDTISSIISGISTTVGSISGTVNTITGQFVTVLADTNAIVSDVALLLADTGNMVDDIAESLLEVIDIATAITGDFTIWLADIPTILTNLQNVWGVITTLVADVTAGIWTAIIDQLAAIFEEIIIVITSLLVDVVDLFGAFIDLLWDTFVEPVLPGITALFDLSIGLLLELVGWVQTAINGVIAFSPLVMVAVTCWLFLLPAFSSEDGGQWIDQMANRLFTDLVGGRLAFSGVSVPVPMIIPYFVATLFFGFVWI